MPDRPERQGHRLRPHSVRLGLVLVLAVTACSSDGSRAAEPTRSTAPTPTRIVLSSTKEVSPVFGQGIAASDGGWILSGRNILARTDANLEVLQEISPAIPPEWAARGYDHVGDIDVVNNVVYVPLEQPNYDLGEQAMARYDATNLAFLDATVVHQHHNSFVAVDASEKIAYSTDQFDDHTLVRYDLRRGWKPMRPRALSKPLLRIQGGAVGHGPRGSGAFWISTDDADQTVFHVDLATGRTRTLGSMGHPGGEGEGIAFAPTGRAVLHTLTVDAAIVPVYIDHWSLE